MKKIIQKFHYNKRASGKKNIFLSRASELKWRSYFNDERAGSNYNKRASGKKASIPFFCSVLLVALLGLPSLCYLLFIYFKNLFYRLGILKEQKVDAKVICVGNLTTGGVGKTPIVCALANHLASKGLRVAVVSRGYGGKLDNKKVNVVKSYEKILIENAALCGDEPYLTAQNTAGVAVLTCRDRVKAAKYAIEHFMAEAIVLDDGFSNRKIHKDINILAIDSEKKFGNNFILPLGPLREPLCEIKRADKLVIVEKNHSGEVEFESYGIPIFTCKMVKDKYYNVFSGEVFELSELEERLGIFAFCAIGQPEQFYNYLRGDFEILGTQEFDDHHIYSEKDIENILAKACKLGAKMLVTTEKDMVKLVQFKNTALPLFVLKLKPQLDLEGLIS